MAVDAIDEVLRAAAARTEPLGAGDAAIRRKMLHAEFRWTTHVGQILDRDEYIRRNTDGATV
jgi:hypothetical protein